VTVLQAELSGLDDYLMHTDLRLENHRSNRFGDRFRSLSASLRYACTQR
jgi:hypothetical protein